MQAAIDACLLPPEVPVAVGGALERHAQWWVVHAGVGALGLPEDQRFAAAGG